VAVSVHLSVIQLPKSPLIGRVSDDRIGYFETSYVELGLNDETGEWNAFVKLCNRWRLQKRDPNCTTGCVPASPITYYIDPSVPRRWWDASAAAVHNWAGAFERAGWKDAVGGKVSVQPIWAAICPCAVCCSCHLESNPASQRQRLCFHPTPFSVCYRFARCAPTTPTGPRTTQRRTGALPASAGGHCCRTPARWPLGRTSPTRGVYVLTTLRHQCPPSPSPPPPLAQRLVQR
jgi:hypothetical protein